MPKSKSRRLESLDRVPSWCAECCGEEGAGAEIVRSNLRRHCQGGITREIRPAQRQPRFVVVCKNQSRWCIMCDGAIAATKNMIKPTAHPRAVMGRVSRLVACGAAVDSLAPLAAAPAGRPTPQATHPGQCTITTLLDTPEYGLAQVPGRRSRAGEREELVARCCVPAAISRPPPQCELAITL